MLKLWCYLWKHCRKAWYHYRTTGQQFSSWTRVKQPHPQFPLWMWLSRLTIVFGCISKCTAPTGVTWRSEILLTAEYNKESWASTWVPWWSCLLWSILFTCHGGNKNLTQHKLVPTLPVPTLICLHSGVIRNIPQDAKSRVLQNCQITNDMVLHPFCRSINRSREMKTYIFRNTYF